MILTLVHIFYAKIFNITLMSNVWVPTIFSVWPHASREVLPTLTSKFRHGIKISDIKIKKFSPSTLIKGKSVSLKAWSCRGFPGS